MAKMTAPVIGMPKWHSFISGVLLAMTATVSPRETPIVYVCVCVCVCVCVYVFVCVYVLYVNVLGH
jgi:hypothetical protein